MDIRRVSDARYISGYRIWIEFEDGDQGVVDLEKELYGPIFAPLSNLDAFRKFSVHPEFKTLVWPNGADLAPEFLYSLLKVAA